MCVCEIRSQTWAMQRSQTWACMGWAHEEDMGWAHEEERSHDLSSLRVTCLEELDGRAQEAS